MKSDELMIGDWVEFRDAHNNSFFDRVKSLDGNLISYLDTPCFGIALNERILLANGFICNDGRYFVLKSHPRIGWDRVTHDLIIGYADTGKIIDYVHQMQQIIKHYTDRKDIAENFILYLSCPI